MNKMWMEWRLTKKFCHQDISWSRKFVGLNIKNQFWQQKQQNGSFTNMNVRSCPQTRPDVGMRDLLVRAGSLVYCIPKWTKLSIFMVKTSSNFMVKHLSLWSRTFNRTQQAGCITALRNIAIHKWTSIFFSQRDAINVNDITSIMETRGKKTRFLEPCE